MSVSGGKGVAVVMEMLGNVNLAADMSTLMMDGGRTCVIGSRGNADVSPRELMVKEVYVTGVILPKASPVSSPYSAAFTFAFAFRRTKKQPRTTSSTLYSA